ncbi:MAG: hypothetical protein ACREOW_06440 [Thermodesulfobacteriota bacterium]
MERPMSGPNEQASNSERYEKALELLSHDREHLYATFGAFLVAHTVLVGLLLQSLSEPPIMQWRPGSFVASVLGLLLCLPWLASLLRLRAYYDLRIAQVKESEPKGWNLVANIGEQFATGKPVTVGTQRLQMPWLARILRVTPSLILLVSLFALSYLAATVVSGPWAHNYDLIGV